MPSEDEKSRGEKLAEESIENLKSMNFEELVNAVKTGSNPFHRQELLSRIEDKQDQVNRGIEALQEGEE
jgi:hypothetical protein